MNSSPDVGSVGKTRVSFQQLRGTQDGGRSAARMQGQGRHIGAGARGSCRTDSADDMTRKGHDFGIEVRSPAPRQGAASKEGLVLYKATHSRNPHESSEEHHYS